MNEEEGSMEGFHSFLKHKIKEVKTKYGVMLLLIQYKWSLAMIYMKQFQMERIQGYNRI